MVNEWAAGGEYSPQGELGHYSQRIEHEWRCGNSLHVQREVGGMEWTGHGNMNWCLVKGWASHLCLCMPWLRVIFLFLECMPFFSTSLSFQEQRQKTKNWNISWECRRSLFISHFCYSSSVTLDMSPSFVVLLIIEYVFSEDLLSGLISVITSFWK